ncbi:SDR family oxidoreductase [Brevundimonas sp.]|uniref:SDR family oxidoreductase n=1 Tax=Brevundimonas sp. TaxID=1871086 RepID=UPI003AF4D461
MRVLVAGATGKTGSRLVRALTAGGHSPVAMVRDRADADGFGADVETRQADLTDLPETICDGCEAVVFAAGSGGSTGEDMTDKVDRDGARALIDLAASARVSRFVMLSSAGAGDPDPDSDLAPYLKAKHDADEHLKRSGLSYAILRPVALTEEDGQGRIRFGDDVDPQGEAARGDVATVLANAVDAPDWDRDVRLMQSL